MTAMMIWYLQLDIVTLYRSDTIQRETVSAVKVLENNEVQRDKVRESYYRMVQSKTDALSFAIQQSMGKKGEYNLERVESYVSTLDINGVYIVDSKGNLLESCHTPQNDFSKKRFNRLRQLQVQNEKQESTRVIYMQYEDEDWLYFSSKLPDGNIVMTENRADFLQAILNGSVSWENKINSMRIGTEGYVFTVSKKDFTIQSHPEEYMVGKDIFQCGVTEESIYSQDLQWLEVEGQRLYGKIEELEDLYLFVVVPKKEIYSNVLYITIIIMVLYAMVNIAVSMYAYFSSKQAAEQASFIEIGEDGEIGIVQDSVNIGRIKKFFFDRRVVHKYNTYSMIGILFIFLSSIFMQQLLSASELSVCCQSAGVDVLETIAEYDNQMKELQEIYNQEYLKMTQFASQLVTDYEELKTREYMQELAAILGVSYVYIFDEDGNVILTNSSRKNFTLSEDPAERSYELRSLLNGKEYLIQEPEYDENGLQRKQYIGVTLWDDEKYANGFLEVAFVPKEMNELADSMSMSEILLNRGIGVDGYAFAVSKENNSFVYTPNKTWIGQDVTKYGIKEEQLVDGFNGYISIGNTQYYGVVNETSEYYLFTVAAQGDIQGAWWKFPILIVLCLLLSLVLMGIILNLHREDDLYRLYGMCVQDELADKTEQAGEQDTEDKAEEKAPQKSRAEIAMEQRWGIKERTWEQSSAEQKVGWVLKLFLFIFTAFIALVYLMAERVLGEESIIRYIVSGNWEKKVSLFSITACIMVVCVIVVSVCVIHKLLFLVAKVSNTKVETVCHLISSCIKYIAGILVLYFCFAQFGVNTQTLLASVGVLSLVIGLAAKDMITDIIAGLFIILEDEFKVGDFVEVDGYFGIVKMIGVRVTKFEWNGQTKILNNSEVKGVINMSGDVSKAHCVVSIDYKESLERVEEILAKELPLLEEKIPGAIGAPFYRGVTLLGTNSVELKISVRCIGYMKMKAMYALNREVKLIFDRYNINIP